MLTRVPRAATIVSLTYVDLFVLTKRDFDGIAAAMPSLARTIQAEIAVRDEEIRRQEQTRHRKSSLGWFDPSEREPSGEFDSVEYMSGTLKCTSEASEYVPWMSEYVSGMSKYASGTSEYVSGTSSYASGTSEHASGTLCDGRLHVSRVWMPMAGGGAKRQQFQEIAIAVIHGYRNSTEFL